MLCRRLKYFVVLVQFLLPILILKWCGDSIWKSSLGVSDTARLTRLRKETTLSPTGGPPSLSVKSNSGKSSIMGKSSPITRVKGDTNEEVENLEASVTRMRRTACIGLQQIMFAVNSINSHLMTVIHEVICKYNVHHPDQDKAAGGATGEDSDNETLGGFSKWSCEQLYRLHEAALTDVWLVIQSIKEPVCTLVQKGFVAVSAIRGGSSRRATFECCSH
jgi:hypothetical protein